MSTKLLKYKDIFLKKEENNFFHTSKISKKGRPPLNRPSCDKGTPELQKRRQQLIKTTYSPEFSASALGILYAHDYITATQFRAGSRYYVLAYHVNTFRNLGHKALSSVALLEKPRHCWSPFLSREDDKDTAIKEWHQVQAWLIKKNPSSHRIVQEVVLDNQLCCKPFDLRYLKHGLILLSSYFSIS